MSSENRKKMQNEAAEQAKLFSWANLSAGRYPELKWIYHIPNGGSRNKIEAVNLKRQGVKPGVPDIHLPVARGKYHSLYIEMKAGKNKPTDNQERWIDGLRENGNAVAVCYGWEQAQEVIEKYLRLQKSGG